MKCHCKYCLPRFFCQTIHDNDFCYYRHSIKANGTNDFGCVQADVARFLVCSVFFTRENNSSYHFQCNTTDANYRTECCTSFFCNINYQSKYNVKKNPNYSFFKLVSTSTIKSIEHHNTNVLNTIIVIGTLFVLVLLAIIIYYSYKRK